MPSSADSNCFASRKLEDLPINLKRRVRHATKAVVGSAVRQQEMN